MKKLEYKININASPKKVWEIMLAPKTYREWVNVSWPNSDYKGKLGKDEKIRFVGDGQGGTLATIDEFKPYDTILARHIAILRDDGSEDYNSPEAKGWIGTLERYTFTESNGMTTLTVVIETNPDWEKMFDDGWPNALRALKELCEK